ncbi:glycosyltransferase [Marinimicrobium agarilyticum]|uniref:glycosyltransferase n=1 Tax=Marinimicrobium agarilyticum TaxID=306546 RepID=UPI0004142F1C|nr:glycosyltransferase [Marinimicrobium agarilyticum]
MAPADKNLRVLHVISGDLWAGAEVQAYTLLSQIHSRCHLKVILMNAGRLHEECRALGIDVDVFNENQFNGVQLVWRLYQTIRAFRPDIIHTHRQKENILGTLAGRLAGYKRSVRTSHGAPEFESKGLRKLRVKLDQWIGRHWQSTVIAVSDDLAKQLESIYPRRHITVIHNGIDESRLAEQAGPSPFEPGFIHVGIIGRLEPVKRVDLFLEAIPLILNKAKETDFWFHVIGDGKRRAELEAKAQALGISERVTFHGHRSDIPSCLVGLDVLVMCSDHEGTPMVALESLALGTAVVAHNVGGLTEMLASQPNLLVDDHSAEGYANATAAVVPRLDRLCVALEKRYTARQNAQATLALYQRLLD